jgi:hypothetical protein
MQRSKNNVQFDFLFVTQRLRVLDVQFNIATHASFFAIFIISFLRHSNHNDNVRRSLIFLLIIERFLTKMKFCFLFKMHLFSHNNRSKYAYGWTFFRSVFTSSVYVNRSRTILLYGEEKQEWPKTSKSNHQIRSKAINKHHFTVLVFHEFFCVRDTNGTYCLMYKYILWLDVFNIWNRLILLLRTFGIDIFTINLK